MGRQKSALQGGLGSAGLGGGGDPRWGLRGHPEAQLVEQDLLLRLRLRMAAEHQMAAIGGRQMHIDHRDGGEVFDGRPWRQSGCQWSQACLEGDLQAIDEEGDKDVCLDALIALVIDGAVTQIVLELLECLLDVLAQDARIADYAADPAQAIDDLLTALEAHWPLDTDPKPTTALPFPDWEHFDQAKIEQLEPLTPGEVLRYFDGAIPTWRHAVCNGIPRRHQVAALVDAMEQARTARRGCSLRLIRAAGGEGKSTLLLQAAADLVRKGSWTALWRPDPDLGLSAADLRDLDPGRTWLIVADDAENLVSALDDAADVLGKAGRAHVHFLLAARDTDWIAAQGKTTTLANRLDVRDDIRLQGINSQDAKAIVAAWERQGDDRLRALAQVTRKKRTERLFKAVRNAGKEADDGSLFGALLNVRFSQAGLRAHLAGLMERLNGIPIEEAPSSLLDALVPVAACHAPGLPGIDERVLADLLGVPRRQVYTRVVNRLGGLSLSDHLEPAPLTMEQIKLSCAGLGVAFGGLVGTDGGSVHALARRAAAWLGERTDPDEKTLGYFKNHQRAADAIATPSPGDLEQAIAWLVAGVREAGKALADPFLRDLADLDALRFEQLHRMMVNR